MGGCKLLGLKACPGRGGGSCCRSFAGARRPGSSRGVWRSTGFACQLGSRLLRRGRGRLLRIACGLLLAFLWTGLAGFGEGKFACRMTKCGVGLSIKFWSWHTSDQL